MQHSGVSLTFKKETSEFSEGCFLPSKFIYAKKKKSSESKKTKTKVVSGSSLCCWLLSIGLRERSAAPMQFSCGFN